MPDSDGLVSDSELLTYVTDSYWELIDLIASKNEDAVTVLADLPSATSPVTSAQLRSPTIATPSNRVLWSRIRHVFYYNGTDYRRLERVSIDEWEKYLNATSDQPTAYSVIGDDIHLLPSPSGPVSLNIAYIPGWSYELDLTDVIEVSPIAFRWEEYVVIDAAIKCLRKEESDTSGLEGEKAMMRERISRSLTSRGGPSRVTETRRYNASRTGLVPWDWWDH